LHNNGHRTASARAGAVLIGADLRARVVVMKVAGELLAQALVALAVMAGNDGVLEQLLLHVARQLRPDLRHRVAERQSIAIVAVTIAVVRHVSLPGGLCRLFGADRDRVPCRQPASAPKVPMWQTGDGAFTVKPRHDAQKRCDTPA
jgi:hypothetical protein